MTRFTPRFAPLAAAALLGLGALSSALSPTAAEARGRGGAIAAGVIGGLAAGALLGAAASAHAEPAYGYGGYAPPPPPRPYGYAPAYYGRPRMVYEEPVYETRRVISYERVPVGYGRRHWDGPYGDRW